MIGADVPRYIYSEIYSTEHIYSAGPNEPLGIIGYGCTYIRDTLGARDLGRYVAHQRLRARLLRKAKTKCESLN